MHDIINYSTSICPFESGKSGKEEEKIQKFEYLENEKSFLDEIKNIFQSFWRAIIWKKNIKLIKIADTSYNDFISFFDFINYFDFKSFSLILI